MCFHSSTVIHSFVPICNKMTSRTSAHHLSFFSYFLPRLLLTIIRNTNTYAAKRVESGKKFMWIPLVVKDIQCYMGLLIYMGLVNAKTLVDYWSTKDIYSFPLPHFAMSRSHFQSISWNLHLKEDEDNKRKKGSPGYDRLCKIKLLYGNIISPCKTYFNHKSNQQ